MEKKTEHTYKNEYDKERKKFILTQKIVDELDEEDVVKAIDSRKQIMLEMAKTRKNLVNSIIEIKKFSKIKGLDFFLKSMSISLKQANVNAVQHLKHTVETIRDTKESIKHYEELYNERNK